MCTYRATTYIITFRRARFSGANVSKSEGMLRPCDCEDPVVDGTCIARRRDPRSLCTLGVFDLADSGEGLGGGVDSGP